MNEFDKPYEHEADEVRKLLTEMIPVEMPILLEHNNIEELITRCKAKFQNEEFKTYVWTTNELTAWLNEEIQSAVTQSLNELVEQGVMEVSVGEDGEFFYSPKEE